MKRDMSPWIISMYQYWAKGFPGGSAGKESACNAGNLGSISGLGRSLEKRKGYPLQYSGLENSVDSIVHGVAKSRTQLNDFHFNTEQNKENKISETGASKNKISKNINVKSEPLQLKKKNVWMNVFLALWQGRIS